MNRNDKVINITIVLSLVVMVLTSYVLYFFIDNRELLSIYTGFFTSLIFLVFAYLSIRWAIKKSINVLLKTVVGGIVVRFIILIVLTYVVHENEFLMHIYFLSAFFISYLVFLMVEIYAVTKILNDN